MPSCGIGRGQTGIYTGGEPPVLEKAKHMPRAKATLSPVCPVVRPGAERSFAGRETKIDNIEHPANAPSR